MTQFTLELSGRKGSEFASKAGFSDHLLACLVAIGKSRLLQFRGGDAVMGDDPTPYFACMLNDRFANLRRRFLASKEQYGTPIWPPSSIWCPQVATIQMRQFVNESSISGFRGNERWAAKLKVEPKLIRVQKMTRKWGSCSSNGTTTIATDLMDQTSGFQDFVVAHELLHLRVPNHGRLFKALMTAHVPGWRSHDVRR